MTSCAVRRRLMPEMLKIRNQSRKILGLPSLPVSATCARVPVVTTYSVTVHAVFCRSAGRQEAWKLSRVAPGVVVTDDPDVGKFPTPVDVTAPTPTPRADSGPMPRADSDPVPRLGTGPMPRAGTGPMRARRFRPDASARDQT
jgi:Semialdehyde dehydrogenase, dimerisation domain